MVYNNLKAICAKKSITFREIEEQASLGAGCISRWKDEKVVPRLDTLQRIANVLEITVDEIVKE